MAAGCPSPIALKSDRIVGIPKEIKLLEKRVGLTPSAVRKLTARGIRVLVEQDAGLLSGFSDSEYRQSGAGIAPDARHLYEDANLIQKVKEPLEAEFGFIRPGHLFFCFLHLASPENSKLGEALVKSGCTAIGFETVESEGKLPILAPMSRIAGGLAAAYAAYFQNLPLAQTLSPEGRKQGEGAFSYPSGFHEGLERVAGFYPDFSGKLSIGKTVIFGGGIAGASALTAVLQMKGEAAIVESGEERRKYLKNFTSFVFASDEIPETVLAGADILIGCVHARGRQAIHVFDEAKLLKISAARKKIILDVAIDQGGNFPEARSTTYRSPLYQDSWGNLRFAVPNIPSFCGRAASEAISEAAFPYTEALALNPEEAFRRFPELERGINVSNGQMRL